MFQRPTVLPKSQSLNINLIKSMIDNKIVDIFRMLNEVPHSPTKQDHSSQTQNFTIDDSYQEQTMDFLNRKYAFQRFQRLSSVNSTEVRSNSPLSQPVLEENNKSKISIARKQKLSSHQLNILNKSINLQVSNKVQRKNSRVHTKNESYEKLLIERKKSRVQKKVQYTPRQKVTKFQFSERIYQQISQKYKTERRQSQQGYQARNKMLKKIEQSKKKPRQFII